ncbi:MAG: YbaN family protein [Anaerosomatales bacterium]|nr:YbaN family protein [Anaerosomatales bacterium]MDT8434792.1 YbaN family protein [Anaerosomatales bacterium]
MNWLGRSLVILVGLISLAIGITGFFFPILPATPFLLVATFLFARSSKRLHDWLLSHGFLGPYISGFLYGTPMPARVKRIAIALLWIGTAFPFFAVWYQVESTTLIAIAWASLLAIGVGFTIYLARLPVGDTWRDHRKTS